MESIFFRNKKKFLIVFFIQFLIIFTWDSSTSGKWASKTGCLVLDDCWLGWFAHDNQLLVRLHHNARKLWEPNAYVNKALAKWYNEKIWSFSCNFCWHKSQLIQRFYHLRCVWERHNVRNRWFSVCMQCFPGHWIQVEWNKLGPFRDWHFDRQQTAANP